MDIFCWVRFNLQLFTLQPLLKSHYSLFYVFAILCLFHFANQQLGKVFFGFSVGKRQCWLTRLFYHAQHFFIGTDADEDADFFRFLQ